MTTYPYSVEWAERWSRPGVRARFTTIGVLPEGVVPPGESTLIAQLSTALVAAIDRPMDVSDDVGYWATLARKLLQRGRLPRYGVRTSARSEEVDWATVVAAMFCGRSYEVDPSLELDPTYEQRFFSDLRQRYPREAAFMIPQAPLEALMGGSGSSANWIDFVLASPGKGVTALEIDGSQHRLQRAVDLHRNQLLKKAGVMTVRVESDPASRRLDSSALFDAVRRGAVVDVEIESAVPSLLAAVRVAYGVVEAVVCGMLGHASIWKVELEGDAPDPDLLSSTLTAMASLDRVWSTGVMPQTIVFVGGQEMSWENSFGSARPVEEHRTTIRVDTGPTWAALDVPQDGVLVRGVPVPACAGWDPPLSKERRDVAVPEIDEPVIDRALSALSGYVLGLPDFRPGQLRALRRVLAGRDALVLLPTGSGKSLIYQLAFFLRPGTTLVVDPIRALMDDQERRLHELGIDRVLAMHRGRAGSGYDRDRQLKEVARGRAIALFVSPERMQVVQFRQSLQDAAHEGLVNLAVVDEAHCVSEWGHDFRTSYLHLARNMRRLGRDEHDVAPPVLGLTGTASPAVLRDVTDELGIDISDPEALQRPDDNDRSNLTFEVLVGDPAGSMRLLSEVLSHHIPNALGLAPAELARPAGSGTTSGVIFTPHAGGKVGVETCRDATARTLRAVGSEARVGVYSGKMSDDERALAASSFQRNELQVLVATKAFGMGIDKPNIRWTAHVGIPSSIEAFVQEAGRAGRDGARARCVIVSCRGSHATVEPHLSLAIPGATRRNNFAAAPSAPLGDVGRQLFFHYGSFPGEEGARGEVQQAKVFVEELARLGARPLGELSVPRLLEPLENLMQAGPPQPGAELSTTAVVQAFERVVHRLVILGVVDDMTVQYGSSDRGSTATLYFSRFDVATVDRAFLEHAARVVPGRHREMLQRVADAPAALFDRITYYLAEVIQIVYEVIEPARMTALREMWRLTCDEPDDQRIRGTIAAYLGGGPMSLLLERLVQQPDVDVHAALVELDGVAVGDEFEWVGASARLLEAYPDHPVLLYVRGCGEAFASRGSVAVFDEQVAQLARACVTYVLDTAARLQMLEGLLRVAVNARRGSLSSWVSVVWESWYGIHQRCEELDLLASHVLSTPEDRSPAELDAALTYRLLCIRSDVQNHLITPN